MVMDEAGLYKEATALDIYLVLFPGAQHPSIQWDPGGGESTYAGKQLVGRKRETKKKEK